MFVDPPKRSEQLLKYALIALTATLVIAVLSAMFLFDITPKDRSGKQPTKQDSTLSPEQEVKLQEQIAPLIKAGDMKACESVSSDMYRKVCINNIALNKANETKNIEYCQYLDNELIERASCERQILMQKSIETENKAVCSETKDEKLKQECEESFLFGMAQKKNDPKLCDQSSDKTKADQCWNGYHAQSMTMPTSDGKPKETDCDLFRGDEVKADCQAFTAAQKTNDQQKLMEICRNQKSQVFVMTCMMMNQKGMGMPGMMRP